MHQVIKRVLAIALTSLAAFAPMAHAEGEVTVLLTAQRVVTDTHGNESFAPGDKAHPGDVLEYRATYANHSASRVRQIAATLPVPQGMEFVAGTASPAPSLASLDGKKFESLPIKRRVRLADGRTVVREVPATEYRSLRWSIASLDGNSERVLKARVRVSPIAVASIVKR